MSHSIESDRASVHAGVLAAAARTPDAIAVSDERQQLTYAALIAGARALAGRVQAVVPAEGRVGIVVERSCALVVALLGTLAAGGAYVPLDPAAGPARWRRVLGDAGAMAVVTTPAWAAAASTLGLPVVLVEEAAGAPARRVAGAQLGYVLYTSGTTGEPKGVAVPHAAVSNLLDAVGQAVALTPADVWLAITPLTFDIAGLEVWLPLRTGARVELAARHTAAAGGALRAWLRRTGATILQATPVTWRLLLETGWRAPRGFRALCGGEALPAPLAAALIEAAGAVWNCYGPTETTIWSTLACLRTPDTPVTIGRPVAQTTIHLIDPKGHLVPRGEIGELHIGGIGLARGYLGRSATTAERFIPDTYGGTPGERLYRTGDLARCTPDGAIECLGRVDHQIKIRGYRIEASAIEAVLERHPAIAQAVVIPWGETDDDDRHLVAYVVSVNGEAPGAHTLREFVQRHLPEYMVPARVVRLDRLPLTPHGKIDRRALPEPTKTAPVGDVRSAPASELARAIAAVWRQVLDVEQIGPDDNFFDLGGTSLKFAEARARLPLLHERDLTIVDLYQYPTVSSLARWLAGSRPEPASSRLGDRAARMRRALSRPLSGTL